MIPKSVEPYKKEFGECLRITVPNDVLLEQFNKLKTNAFDFRPGILRNSLKAEKICELWYKKGKKSFEVQRHKKYGDIQPKLNRLVTVCDDSTVIKEVIENLELKLNVFDRFLLYAKNPISCYFLVEGRKPRMPIYLALDVDPVFSGNYRSYSGTNERLVKNRLKELTEEEKEDIIKYYSALVEHKWNPKDIHKLTWLSMLLTDQEKFYQYYIDCIPKIRATTHRQILENTFGIFNKLTEHKNLSILRYLESDMTAKEIILMLYRLHRSGDKFVIKDSEYEELQHQLFIECIKGRNKTSKQVTNALKILKGCVVA